MENKIKNYGVILDRSLFIIWMVIFSMTRYAKRNPIIKFSKIFTRFISPFKFTYMSFIKFTGQRFPFFSIYPAMQSIITHFITFPHSMFFTKSGSIMTRYRTEFTSTSLNPTRMFKKFLFTNQTITLNELDLIPRYLTFNKNHA